MKTHDYELTPDEIALMVHHALRELHPESEIDSRLIRAAVTVESDGLLAVRVGGLGSLLGSAAEELARELYLVLNIEWEKNWHDRAFFNIVLDGETIFFRKAK